MGDFQDMDDGPIGGVAMVDYDKHIHRAIRALDSAEVDLMGIPGNERRRALQLELEMTRACNRDDEEHFFRYLEKWRTLLLGGSEGEDPGQGSLFK